MRTDDKNVVENPPNVRAQRWSIDLVKNPPNVVRVQNLPIDLEDFACHDDCEEDLPAFVHKPYR
jgi:hypothetical protein